MNLNKEELKAKPDLILAHESQKNSAGKVLKSLKDKGKSRLCERCTID